MLECPDVHGSNQEASPKGFSARSCVDDKSALFEKSLRKAAFAKAADAPGRLEL